MGIIEQSSRHAGRPAWGLYCQYKHAYPQRTCSHWKKGHCKYGTHCIFAHSQTVADEADLPEASEPSLQKQRLTAQETPGPLEALEPRETPEVPEALEGAWA